MKTRKMRMRKRLDRNEKKVPSVERSRFPALLIFS